MADIKQKVTDFLNFDLEGKYDDDDAKEQLVDMFKDIVSENNETLLQFLKQFFETAKELAKEFDLLADEEEPVEDEEDQEGDEGETEEGEEAEAEVEADESVEADDEEVDESAMIGTANRFLSDYDR